jgi:hypothetical protein
MVKRYDFDCYAFYDSARMSINECEDGDYVLHSDYAALEASYVALREAVAKMFVAEDDIIEDAQVIPDSYTEARAEVDRLLEEK